MESIIKDFEKLGYSHDDAKELAELSFISDPVKFNPITDEDLAEMFNITMEELSKSIEDGTFISIADIPEELVDKFNNVETGYPIFACELREIMENYEEVN